MLTGFGDADFHRIALFNVVLAERVMMSDALSRSREKVFCTIQAWSRKRGFGRGDVAESAVFTGLVRKSSQRGISKEMRQC